MITLQYNGRVYQNFENYTSLLKAGVPESVVLEHAKARKIIEVKEEAYRRIVAIMPEWKQRNLIARAGEIINRKLDGNATQAELDELAQIQTLWDQVKAIRAASDQIESEIQSLQSLQEVENYRVSGHPSWP